MARKRRRILCGLALVILALIHPTAIASAVFPSRAPLSPVEAVALSPDESKLAVGRKDGTVEIRDAATEQVLFAAKHPDWVVALAWSPDGSRLASGGAKSTIRIWDVATGQLLVSQKHEDIGDSPTWEGFALAWSPDGEKLATGSIEGYQNLRVWNPSTGQLLVSIVAASIVQLAWSFDNQKVAITNTGGIIQVWDITTGQMLYRLKFPENSMFTPYSVAWSPGSHYLVTGGVDGTIQVWDMTMGWPIASFESLDKGRIDWDTTAIYSLRFSPNGARLFSISASGLLAVRDMNTHELLSATRVHTPISAADFGQSGDKLAYGSPDGTVSVVPVMLNPSGPVQH